MFAHMTHAALCIMMCAYASDAEDINTCLPEMNTTWKFSASPTVCVSFVFVVCTFHVPSKEEPARRNQGIVTPLLTELKWVYVGH